MSINRLVIIFQNQHYVASGKPGMLVVESKRKVHGVRGVYLTDGEANKWIKAFKEDIEDRSLCNAYCRSLLA